MLRYSETYALKSAGSLPFSAVLWTGLRGSMEVGPRSVLFLGPAPNRFPKDLDEAGKTAAKGLRGKTLLGLRSVKQKRSCPAVGWKLRGVTASCSIPLSASIPNAGCRRTAPWSIAHTTDDQDASEGPLGPLAPSSSCGRSHIRAPALHHCRTKAPTGSNRST